MLSRMENTPKRLTFTDEQILAAVKAVPDLMRAAEGVAMQMELMERREADERRDDDGDQG